MSENGGCRKSTRERKEKKIFTPEVKDKPKIEEKSNLVKKPKKSSNKACGTTSVDRPCDTLPNGKPFCCDLCRSKYVCNPFSKKKGRGNAKEKVSRHTPYPRQKVDPKTGKVLILCNACGISIDRCTRPKKPKELPSDEVKQKYMDDAKQFAAALAKDLGDPEAERLYCPSFQLSPCGCLQKYLRAKGERKESEKRAKELLDIFKESKKLSLQKCYNIEELLANKRSKRARNIGLGNGQKRSKQFENYVMIKREYLKKNLCICERSCQKILSYSNNFLHKRLKTDERSRAKRVKGKAELGLLMPLDDLYKEKCCIDNCVMMILTHKKLLESWRCRAMSGQQEARRVLAEMLTPSGGDRINCYKFINMITGRSPGTIARVSEQMKRTGGDRSPPTHGLKSYFKLNPRKKAKRRNSSDNATEDKNSSDEKQQTSEKSQESKGESNSSNRKQTATLTFEQQREQLIQLQKQLIESQIQIQQLVQQQMLQHTLLQHTSHNDLMVQNLSSIQQMVNQLNQQLHIAQQQMQQPQIISLPSMLQMQLPNTAIQLSQPPPNLINIDATASNSTGHQIPSGVPVGNIGFHINNQSQHPIIQPVQVPVNVPMNIQMQLQQIQQLMQMMQQNASVGGGMPNNCGGSQITFPQQNLIPPQVRVRSSEQTPAPSVMHQQEVSSPATDGFRTSGTQYVFSNSGPSTYTAPRVSVNYRAESSDLVDNHNTDMLHSSDKTNGSNNTDLHFSLNVQNVDNYQNSESSQKTVEVQKQMTGVSPKFIKQPPKVKFSCTPSVLLQNNSGKIYQPPTLRHVDNQVSLLEEYIAAPLGVEKSLSHPYATVGVTTADSFSAKNMDRVQSDSSKELSIESVITSTSRDQNNARLYVLPKLQKHSSKSSVSSVNKTNIVNTSSVDKITGTIGESEQRLTNYSNEIYVQKKHKAKFHHVNQGRDIRPPPVTYVTFDAGQSSSNLKTHQSSLKSQHTEGVLKHTSSIEKEKLQSSLEALERNENHVICEEPNSQSCIKSYSSGTGVESVTENPKVQLQYHLNIPNQYTFGDKSLQILSQDTGHNSDSVLETSKIIYPHKMSQNESAQKNRSRKLTKNHQTTKSDKFSACQSSITLLDKSSEQTVENQKMHSSSNNVPSSQDNEETLINTDSYTSRFLTESVPSCHTGFSDVSEIKSHYSSHMTESSPHPHSNVVSDSNTQLNETSSPETIMQFSSPNIISSPIEVNSNGSHVTSPYDIQSNLHHTSLPHHSYILSQDITYPHNDSVSFLNPHCLDRPMEDHQASASLLRMALLSAGGNHGNTSSNMSTTSHRDPVLSSVQGNFRMNEAGDNHLNVGEYMTLSADALQQIMSQPGITMVKQSTPTVLTRHVPISDKSKH